MKLNCTLIMVLLIGCGDGIPFIKIDFSKNGTPKGVIGVSGLSEVTRRGRWSDANLERSVKINFQNQLPRKLSIIIRGKSLLKSSESTLIVGQTAQRFLLSSNFDDAEIFIENPTGAKTIEIVPDHPTMPKTLGINNDQRKLSILLSSITVYKDG